MDDSTPRIRASDNDRNRVTAALSEAFAEGKLDYEELDERTQQVWNTRYRDELLTPLADLFPDPTEVLDPKLPEQRAQQSPAPQAPRNMASQQVTGEANGLQSSIAIMGGSEKSGNWLCAPTHAAIAIMGGTEIDLRRARLASHETVITAVALMGGIEIVVPDDVVVISDGVGIMGGFGVTSDKDVTLRMDQLPLNAPVIRVRGLGIMGGVGVRRARRNSDS